MAAVKITALCLIASFAVTFFFFVSSSQVSATRTEPTFHDVTPMENLHGEVEVEATEKFDRTAEASCDGVADDDCLMRRTLAAHTDYIYTQKNNP